MILASVSDSLFHLHLPVEEKIFRSILVFVFLVFALRFGGKRELAQLNVLDLAVGPLGSLQGGVRFVDVGLVVLVVVDAHRRLVDVGLERVVSVRKVGNRKGHLASPLIDIRKSAGA